MGAFAKVHASLGTFRGLLAIETRSNRGTISFGHFLAITLQLALVGAVIHIFRIEEGSGFIRILPLIAVGFALHAWLPLQFRPPFLLSLTFLAIAVNFGYPHGVMLVGAGLGLFVLASLPVAFWIRVALLLAAGVILVALRAEWVQTRWIGLPALVIPVLASMFMFRMIVYMYDSRHMKTMGNIWERLSFFFMLPNVAFLLFPVVDFQTYKRSYYNVEAASVYQKGVAWIMRGVMHLVLYRIVYYFWLPSPSDVTGILTLAQYMLATYLLYLRISGHFHVIIGILCLFGYNLPETHHLYYLASSFNDYWRRINIYWKDFMMKLFYYPSFMRLRKIGMMRAIALSTIVVFVGTWLLHAYQWFWLRGSFLLTAPDMLFWAVLGLLVVVNSLVEAKRGRRQAIGGQSWSAERAFKHAFKVLAMFVTLTILWTLWSTPSLSEFGSLMAAGLTSPGADWILVLSIMLLAVLVGVGIQFVQSRGLMLTAVGSHVSFARSARATSATAVVLLLLGTPQIQNLLDPQPAALVAGLQQERLNERDEQLMERGYYEGLLTSTNFTSVLWQSWKPKDWGLDQEHLFVRRTDDLYKKVLIPHSDVEFCGAPLHTNRWGMRDDDYDAEKPAGTVRIALLGDSHVMGMGVANHETFEAVLEERLNRAFADEKGRRFELLNFAVTAYTLIQQVIVNEEKVPRFQPDAVFYVAHPGEVDRTLEGFISRAIDDTDLQYPYLKRLKEEANVEAGMSAVEARRRLEPYRDELLDWTYRQIAETARTRGVRPVWVFMPFTHVATDDGELDDLKRRAGRAGFATISLAGVYDGHALASIVVAPWDKHPNAFAHRLVADRLYNELIQRRSLLESTTDLPIREVHNSFNE